MGTNLDDGLNQTKPTPQPPDPIDVVAGLAWTAYSDAVGGKSAVTDAPLPTWDALRADPEKVLVVQGWRAAAQAVWRHADEKAKAAQAHNEKLVDNPAGTGEAESSAGATTPPDQNLAAQTGI